MAEKSSGSGVVAIFSFRLVLTSVQLAFARQDAKEQEKSDDDWRRSDDSYSPRRHWRFRSPTISVGPGLRTDV
jgi:ribosomal protein L32E